VRHHRHGLAGAASGASARPARTATAAGTSTGGVVGVGCARPVVGGARPVGDSAADGTRPGGLGGGGRALPSSLSAIATRMSAGAHLDWFRRRRWLAFHARFPRGPLALLAFACFARRDAPALFHEGARLAMLLLATDIDGAVAETIMQWFYARSDEPFFPDVFAVLRADRARLRGWLLDVQFGAGSADAAAAAAAAGAATASADANEAVSGGAPIVDDDLDGVDDLNQNARDDTAHYFHDDDASVMRLFSIIELLCVGNRAQAYRNYMRHQADNYRSYDLVSESATYLAQLTRMVSSHARLATRVVVAITALVHECAANQEIVLRSKVWPFVNTVLLASADALAAVVGETHWLDLQLAIMQLLLTLLDNDDERGLVAHALLLRLDPRALVAHTRLLDRINGTEYAVSALARARHLGAANSALAVMKAAGAAPARELRERRIRLASRALQCASTLVERAESFTSDHDADEAATAAAAVVAASMAANELQPAPAQAQQLQFDLLGGGGDAGCEDIVNSFRSALETMSLHCNQRIGSVEVVLASGALERVYFPVPLECQAVHGGAEMALMTSLIDFMVARDVNWSNPTDKIATFMQWCEEQLVRLDTRAGLLARVRVWRFIAEQRNMWLDLSLLLSLALNVMLLAMERPTFLNRHGAEMDDSDIAFAVVGAVHVVSSLLVTLSFYLRVGPLINYSRWRHVYAAPARDKTSSYLLAVEQSRAAYLRGVVGANRAKYYALTLYHYLADVESIFHILNLVFALLGVALSSYLFVAHLFQIVLRYEQLKTIVRAIYNIIMRLLLTFALALVSVYALSMLAFLVLRDVYVVEGGVICSTFFTCFLSAIYYGVPLNGGLVQVDAVTPPWSARPGLAVGIVAYQLLFFVVVGTFMINILLALIVDEFGNLRGKRALANTERFTRCFVCSIERETFLRNGVDFAHHIRFEHNIVHYMYFFAHLKYADVLKYGAAERYVFERTLDEAYHKFFPIGRALSIDAQDEKRSAAAAAAVEEAVVEHKIARDIIESDEEDAAAKQEDEFDNDDDDDDVDDKQPAEAPPVIDSNARIEALLQQLLSRLDKLEGTTVQPKQEVEEKKKTEVEPVVATVEVEKTSEVEPPSIVVTVEEPVQAATTTAAVASDSETDSEEMIAALLASRPAAKNPYLDDSDDD
jgi:hypothetical protein